MYHLVTHVQDGQWASACGEILPDRPAMAGEPCPDCTFMVHADQDLRADLTTVQARKTAWWKRETEDQA
jgi:hypothetical protein